MLRLINPSWVSHADEKGESLAIGSVDVHPDGSRFVTGGADHRVKIWSMTPVLEEVTAPPSKSTVPKIVISPAPSPDEPHTPLLLATLSNHTGAVNVVRWSNGGQFMASGERSQDEEATPRRRRRCRRRRCRRHRCCCRRRCGRRRRRRYRHRRW